MPKDGTPPTNLLEFNVTEIRLVKLTTEEGREPPKSKLFWKLRTLRYNKFPMLFGIVPVNDLAFKLSL